MQVGEAAINEVADDDCHDPQTCLICAAAPHPEEATNNFVDDYNEDKDIDGPTIVHNDSAALGRALIAAGYPQPKFDVELVSAHKKRKSFDVSTAAHHLIPGHGSLTKSKLYTEKLYLVTAGSGPGNIGYDVNAAENGVWLPGNYAQRPWGPDGAAFLKTHGVTPAAYAAAAMAVAGQFHDAHSEYSKFVCGVLNRIHEKLEQNQANCPEATRGSKLRNLRGLIWRLHHVSARMRRMLVLPGPSRNNAGCWKRNIFTSRFGDDHFKNLAQQADA